MTVDDKCDATSYVTTGAGLSMLQSQSHSELWTYGHALQVLYSLYMLLALLAHPKHFKRSVIPLEPVPTARNPFVDLIEYSLPKYNSNQV
jgi:hypothetical protein